MKTNKCTVEKIPDPPPPDPCFLQKIREKEEAGVKICPKPPVEQQLPPPKCLALCIEKIKNPPVPPGNDQQSTVCVVKREKTGTERCDAIRKQTENHAELPWPGCPPPVLPSPRSADEQK